MAITVKKKKLTVKTVRTKAGDLEGVDGAAEEGATEAVAAMPAPAVISTPAVKQASYTVAGVFAIIAFVFFVALIVLQAMEWSFYMDAIPRPLAPGMAGAGPAYTPTAPADGSAGAAIEDISAPAAE